MKWLSFACGLCVSVVAAAGGPGSEPLVGGDFLPDKRPLATTLVYDCNGYEFVTRLGPGEMALWLPDRYLVLSQVRSASGTRYQEGEVTFWSKGDEAMLFVDGLQHRDCRLLPRRAPWEDARLRGVDFRAVGNEPGWLLEIRRGRDLLYVGDYGSQRVVTPYPEEQRDGDSRRYHAVTEANELIVEITATPCFDTMSGEGFQAAVNLTVNGRTLRGCGRQLTAREPDGEP
jgi:membrane-bound inhibitor of C-type lysozyme/uncharacterized membrane protein